MTKEQREKTARQLTYLLGCAVRKETPEAGRLSDADVDYILDLASHHMLAAAASMALQNAGIKNARTERSILKSHRRTIVYQSAWEEIKKHLDQEDIWYMPLKGILWKELYPDAIMREMSDYDILIDPSRARDVRTLMENLGFRTESFDQDIHDVYLKDPVLQFEIHTSLFGIVNMEKIHQYYVNVKDRLIPVRGCEYRFSPEDGYLFMIAHEYKHYRNSGTGLRSLLDTYVYLRTVKPDMDYIAAEAQKLGISEFEESNRMLALHLFDQMPLTDSEEEMLAYMLSSNVYGTMDNRVNNYRKKHGRFAQGKLGYLLTRLFVPMNDLKTSYPFFYKHKVLLPFLVIYRVFKVLLFHRDQIKYEWKSLKRLSDKKKKEQ